MKISDITSAAPDSASAASRASDKVLGTACHEFEGMLLGNILKQGMAHQPDEDEAEESCSNNSMMTDFAAEQTARALSGSDITGIATLLQRQMRKPVSGA